MQPTQSTSHVGTARDVQIQTFDNSQSQERDHVILDMVASHQLGFLKVNARVVTGFSRVKNSMLVVCNRKALEGADVPKGRYIALLDFFKAAATASVNYKGQPCHNRQSSSHDVVKKGWWIEIDPKDIKLKHFAKLDPDTFDSPDDDAAADDDTAPQQEDPGSVGGQLSQGADDEVGFTAELDDAEWEEKLASTAQSKDKGHATTKEAGSDGGDGNDWGGSGGFQEDQGWDDNGDYQEEQINDALGDGADL